MPGSSLLPHSLPSQSATVATGSAMSPGVGGFDTIFVQGSGAGSGKNHSTTSLLATDNHNMIGYMYILRCRDGTYYVGSTNNLELRLAEHHSGHDANYTKCRRPVELVYYEQYEYVADAVAREKQVQGWSRKKREALINGEYPALPALAKKVFRKDCTGQESGG